MRTMPYKFSTSSWNQYAKRIGAKMFVLDKFIVEEEKMNANWHKLMIFEILEKNGIDYDHILIVDSDTIIHPDAPNIFEEYPSDEFKAVHNAGSYDWLLRSMEVYKKHIFNKENYGKEIDFDFTDYFNSGVMMVSKKHKEFFGDILDLYLNNHQTFQQIQEMYHVGTDQPVINFMLQGSDHKLELMDYAWNMQDMVRREILNTDLLFTKYGWVYHFNAIPQQFKLTREDVPIVFQWMQFTYQKLYA